ncbi:MAG: hypothetical protein ACFB0B_13400 [Thermonemataceae bacterium]
MNVRNNTFWKNIAFDWAGVSSEVAFSHPFFDNQEVEIFLGEEFDEEGEEVGTLPTEEELKAYENTYKAFLENIAQHLSAIQQAAYQRYREVYAAYYESEEKSGAPPLQITSVEAHNPYIKELLYLKITEDNTLRVLIRYQLDEEHGLEFKFVNGKLVTIGGIAET